MIFFKVSYTGSAQLDDLGLIALSLDCSSEQKSERFFKFSSFKKNSAWKNHGGVLIESTYFLLASFSHRAISAS